MKTPSTKTRSAATRVAAVGIVAALLTACGGGDDDAQNEVADEFLDEMSDEDVALDEDCVRDAFGELSDDDAQAVLDSLEEGSEPDIGENAAGVVDDVMSCVDMGAMADQIIDDMVDEMGADNVDADCLRDAIGDLDVSSIDDPESSDFATAMIECVSIGG